MPNFQPEKKEEIVLGKEAGDAPKIRELKERIEKLETQLKKEQVSIPEEKEKIVKREIKSYLQELQQAPSLAAPLTTRDEAKEIKKFEPNQQVGALVLLVFEKGLLEAISVAKTLGNPALLDEFHDTLVDHYYKVLVEKEIIKPL